MTPFDFQQSFISVSTIKMTVLYSSISTCWRTVFQDIGFRNLENTLLMTESVIHLRSDVVKSIKLHCSRPV